MVLGTIYLAEFVYHPGRLRGRVLGGLAAVVCGLGIVPVVDTCAAVKTAKKR